MTTHDTTPDAEEGEEGNALLGLQTLTTKIRSEIADALKAGDDPRLFKASEQLRNVNALKEKHKAVWLETQALLNAGLGNEQPNHVQPTSVHSSPASSRPPESQSVQHKKANGKRLRDEWINQHGQALNHLGRTLYRTP